MVMECNYGGGLFLEFQPYFRDHHHNYIPLPLYRGFQPENNKMLQTRRWEIKKTNNSLYYN
jgi:hypothetical protein